MPKKIKAEYTLKVYKKGTNTYLKTHTITAHDSEAAAAQLEYEYWVKFGKPEREYDVINVKLISSTRLQKWCLFYITEEKKAVIEHHLYTEAFSLKEAKKHFKSTIEKIPKDSGYLLYASKELKQFK